MVVVYLQYDRNKFRRRARSVMWSLFTQDMTEIENEFKRLVRCSDICIHTHSYYFEQSEV